MIAYIPGLALGIGFNLIIIGVFYLALNRKIKIKTNFFEINTIENLNRFYEIYVQSLKIRDEENEIKYIRRLYEQMNSVDTATEEIKARLMTNFYNILKDKQVQEIHTNCVFKNYSDTISLMMEHFKIIGKDDFKCMLRLFDKENNLTDNYEFIRAEFEEWKNKRISAHINRASEFIGQHWIDNPILTRQSAYDLTLHLIPGISTSISDVYISAIMIQLKYSKKLKEFAAIIDNYKNSLKPENKKLN